jgi:serine/threonine protein kinase
MNLQRNERVLGNRWLIIRELGRGGMGIVYVAKDTHVNNQEVAVKELKSSNWSSDDVEKMRKEVELARSLNDHPNIVTTLDFQHLSNECFIVMELLKGESLEKRLNESPNLTLHEVMEIAARVADALDFAHKEKRILHLDIKPANIIVGERFVKLIDFGLAKALEEITSRGTAGGTPPYIAPERLRGQEFDERADVFSFGMLVSKMVTGHYRFDEPRQSENDKPRIDKRFSDEVNGILTKAVEWRPQDRWSSAGDFVDVLIEALENDGRIPRDTVVQHRHRVPQIPQKKSESNRLDFKHLVGECLFCGKKEQPYNPSASRFCCTKNLPRDVQARFGDDIDLYPTIFPVPERDDPSLEVPHPSRKPFAGVFAISNRPGPESTQEFELPSFPYEVDCPEMAHLRCGNATLYNLDSLATDFQFEANRINVFDMSTYYWSNTLKDPRSWAVVMNAVNNGICHLGLWTAGNAGLSLAKLVHAVNFHLEPDKRITVYCYAEKDALKGGIGRTLESFRARVVPFERHHEKHGKIFTPDQARQFLNGRLGLQLHSHEYWDVSDGWDGVGLYMYRLLGRQISKLRPRYVVAPVGTGNLFYGLYLGMRDCLRAEKISREECHLIGAVPVGDAIESGGGVFENILTNFREYGIDVTTVPGRSSTRLTERPMAPKLETIYTPLLLGLCDALMNDPERITLMEVTGQDQNSAAQKLISKPHGQSLAIEPSALMAFGCLERLSERHRANRPTSRKASRVRWADADVVVINSGCGNMARQELEFLDQISLAQFA